MSTSNVDTSSLPPLFKLDTSRYPAFDTNIPNLRLISTPDFAEIWQDYQRTRHFTTMPTRVYPQISVSSGDDAGGTGLTPTSRDDLSQYEGLMVVEFNDDATGSETESIGAKFFGSLFRINSKREIVPQQSITICTTPTTSVSGAKNSSEYSKHVMLVGAVDIKRICTDPGKEHVAFREKKRAPTVRNWLSQAGSFADISHLVIYCPSGSCTRDGTIKPAVLQLAKALSHQQRLVYKRFQKARQQMNKECCGDDDIMDDCFSDCEKDGGGLKLRHTLILAEDLMSIQTNYPELLKPKIFPNGGRAANPPRSQIMEIENQMQMLAFDSTEIAPNIVMGNIKSFRAGINYSDTHIQKSENPIEEIQYDLMVECITSSCHGNSVSTGYQHQGLNPVIAKHEIKLPLLVDTPNKLQFLESLHAASWNRPTLFRVYNGSCSDLSKIEAICATAKFIASKAASGKRVLIFDYNGNNFSVFFGFATMICSRVLDANNSGSSRLKFNDIVADFARYRPFLANPTFQTIFQHFLSQENHNDILCGDDIDNHPVSLLSFASMNKKSNGLIYAPAQIIPNLYLGSLEESTNPDMNRRLNIRHVLRLIERGPAKYSHDDGEEDTIREWYIDKINDDARQSLYPYLMDAIRFIDEGLVVGEGVLVHCQAGVSRSATLIIAYLMFKRHMTIRQAFCFVRNCRLRYVVQPNEQFMFDLLEFELDLFGKRSVSWIDLCDDLHSINAQYSSTLYS